MWLVFAAILLILGNLVVPSTDTHAQTGIVLAAVTPSNSAPEVGQQITVAMNIDVSGVQAPNNALGSYTAQLQWNPSVLSFVSYTGAPPSGFTGVENTANTGTGVITFNGANASGAPGNTVIMTITFNVIAGGNASLNLSFSSMAAASTFNSLLGLVSITQASVIVAGTTAGEVEVDGAVSTNSVETGSSISISHTTGTGTDRLMLLGVSWNAGSSAKTISSVQFTYGTSGQLNFSEVHTETATATGTTSGPRYSAIWGSVDAVSGELLAIPLNTAGTLTITFSTEVTNGIVAGVANFKGVDPDEPLGTPNGANTTNTVATVSVDLTTNGTELVFDNVWGGGSSAPTLTVNASQTQLWKIMAAGSSGSSTGGASTKQAAAGTTTMNWTRSDNGYMALSAVPINPAAGEPPVCYALTLTSGSNGSAPTAVPTQSSGCASGSYTPGQLINLTAHPATGYQVASWSGTNNDALKTTTNQVTMPTGTRTVNVLYEQQPAAAIVEIDGPVSSGTADTSTTISIAHTTGTGNNRLMLVGVSWNCSTTNKDIVSVEFSYGSTDLLLEEVITQVVNVTGGSVNGPRYSAIYASTDDGVLVQPPQNTSGTLTITFSPAVEHGIVAGVVNFKGVNPIDPLGTPGGATGQTTDPSLTLSGLGGKELIFDNVFLGIQDNTYTLTVGANQTQHWNTFSGNTRGTASTEQAAGSSVTMSWDAATENWWAQTAVPINPASTPNLAPILDPIGDQPVIVGSPLSFTATATDDGLPSGTLTFSLKGGLSGSVPAGASIVGATGLFTWTPGTTGSYVFDVCVSDGALEDCETITITVNPIIPPPTQSSYYGEIHYQTGDGAPAVGDYIEAYITGINGYINRATIQSESGGLIYTINVDGDDLGTPEKDGGVQNDIVIFKINGRVVATGVWIDMANTSINIHPPKADAGSAYAVLLEAGTINLAGSYTDWLMSGTFTFAWDFDDDGVYDDATGQNPAYLFSEAGTSLIGLKVTDGQGGEGVDETPLFVVDLDGLDGQVYNGSPHPVTVSGVDAPYTTTVLYGDPASATPPTNAGSYPVIVQIKEGTEVLATLNVQLVIAKATATVSLSNLEQPYDGSPKPVTVTTNPVGLTVVVTYDGSTTPPTNPGSYAVIAVIDNPNYQGSTSGTLKITGATHSINLLEGWNLISFNVTPNSNEIADVLDSIDGKYSLVYAWDVSGNHSSTGNWVRFDPTVPYGNTLSTLDVKTGFWIFMDEPATLTVTGIYQETETVQLSITVGGWNLVGYPSAATLDLPGALTDHGVMEFTLVYAYHAADTSDPWKLFDPAVLPIQNDLTALSPGWGYWIYVTEDADWQIEY